VENSCLSTLGEIVPLNNILSLLGGILLRGQFIKAVN
jgi:hypothetical protein